MTVTLTVAPEVSLGSAGGTVTVQVVVDAQSTFGAGLPGPKSTVVPSATVEKLVPLMVTLLPPATEPEEGEIELTCGVADGSSGISSDNIYSFVDVHPNAMQNPPEEQDTNPV